MPLYRSWACLVGLHLCGLSRNGSKPRFCGVALQQKKALEFVVGVVLTCSNSQHLQVPPQKVFGSSHPKHLLRRYDWRPRGLQQARVGKAGSLRLLALGFGQRCIFSPLAVHLAPPPQYCGAFLLNSEALTSWGCSPSSELQPTGTGKGTTPH